MDKETQRHITDILEQVDQGVDPSVLSNNLSALSGELGNTQAGRLILTAMQQYAGENSNIIQTSAAQAKTTHVEEEKRKKREQLNAIIDALNDYDETFNAWLEDNMARFEKNVETFNAMADAIPQIEEASAKITSALEAAYPNPTEREAQDIEESKNLEDSVRITAQELQKNARELSKKSEEIAKKEQRRQELLQNGESTSKIDAELYQDVASANILVQQSAEAAHKLENFVHQQVVLAQNALARDNLDPEARQNLQESLDAILIQYHKLHDLQAKFQDDNLSVSKKRELSKEINTTINNVKDIVETYKTTIDPKSENAPQAYAAIEDMQNTLNQQQDALNVAQQNLINAQIYSERLADINNKYESRTDFLDAHHGGGVLSFLGRHLDNLSDYIFDSHNPDDHVQTKDGDFVFHNNETGKYYFYPDNDPSAHRQMITNPVEIIDIGLQATAAYNPKFFANETSLGANYEGLLDNFSNAATTEQNIKQAREEADAELARQKALTEENTAKTTSTSFANTADPVASKTSKLSQTFASKAAPDPAANNSDYAPTPTTEEHTQTRLPSLGGS